MASEDAENLFGGDDASDEDEDVDMVDSSNDMPNFGDNVASSTEPLPLPTRIITPSPYPHHTRGATSARFRNALNRVTTHPMSDSEAWAALLTEVQTCWRQLQPTLHAPSVETQARLDFLVSCYGALLHYFPCAVEHASQLGDMLLEASARPGEPGGPNPTTAVDTQRLHVCEGQLETLFQKLLNAKSGVEFGLLYNMEKDSNADTNSNEEVTVESKVEALSFLQTPVRHEDHTAPKTTTSSSDNNDAAIADTSEDDLQKVVGGMGCWSVSLWMIFLKKVHRDLKRQAGPNNTHAKWLRDKMVGSYELALSHVGFGYNNQLVWTDYLKYLKSWTGDTDVAPTSSLQQEQMIQLRSVYQRLVQLPMTGLDNLWQEYESFERSHSEELATALLADYKPKYQHARTVYLERDRIYHYTGDLQLGRLATPPVTRHSDNQGGSENVEEGTAGAGSKQTMEDYLSNLQEEYKLLQAWKKRVSYERTNPEQLSVAELPQRMRHAYLEMVSVLTHHPEVWHMWSMYEYYHAHRPVRALAVLQLGLQHIPDCTLLAHTQAQLVEDYCGSAFGTGPNLALQVLENFLQTSPNTLAFCLYQQMVRRYQGMKPARAVFSKARCVLTENTKLVNEGDKAKQEDENGDGGKDASGGSKRWMVTNRLDPNVNGRKQQGDSPPTDPKTEATVEPTSGSAAVEEGASSAKVATAPITWHLYASHATMEHRVNHLPQVAARIFELGLRNHPQFLTQPPFVLKYAQLLLELNDTENLRALLTRAVSASTDEDGISSSSSSQRSSVAAVLWDMSLQFETILTGADPMASQLIQDVERKRHMALMGPDLEDVATGGYQLESSLSTTIGAQKSTIAEQLIRNDGYDISSMVVNGMARSVSVLEVLGLWGSNIMGSSDGLAKQRSQSNKTALELLEGEENPSERSGGSSDSSYQRRLLYQQMHETGMLQQSGGGIGGLDVSAGAAGAGNKMLSARERLATSGGAIAGTSAAVAMAIQQQPEWIRPLLLMLPMSKLRLPVLTKPPPHLTELALQQLLQATLPDARPQDSSDGTAMSQRSARISGQKRSMNGGGDSSDEDDGATGGGGYGMQFRSRQRARQVGAGVGDAGAEAN